MSLAESVFRTGQAPARATRGVLPSRALFFATSTLIALAIVASFASAVTEWTAAAYVALPFVALAGFWIAGGAVTSLLGALPARGVRGAPPGWLPAGDTAILVTLCGEDAEGVARRVAELRRDLDRVGLGQSARIFILSDTSGAARISAEEAALRRVVADGAAIYRRRARNPDRKPGNIAEWLSRSGEAFSYMMVLDADSRMTGARIRSMVHRMETRPGLGLLQAGISLVPGRSRFGRFQRVSSRLLSPGFARGYAAWTGESGNYWGHNAIMRVPAFREAARLPRLSGPAPFGGPLLSHDFVEAAWIRRAGWSVELDPDMAGSAEDGPQSVEEFHRRDRRWCQGNLQHIRLLAEPGLDPVSRFHLAAGAGSYLAAPVWLVLVGLIASGAVRVSGVVPFVLIAIVLALPKLCALVGHWRRIRTRPRRAVMLRAWMGELALSTMIAPLMMVRQTASVLSVCMGRDCGWKSGNPAPFALPHGAGEAAAGAALAGLALSTGGAAIWLVPVVLPLLAAPVILPALDAVPA